MESHQPEWLELTWNCGHDTFADPGSCCMRIAVTSRLENPKIILKSFERLACEWVWGYGCCCCRLRCDTKLNAAQAARIVPVWAAHDSCSKNFPTHPLWPSAGIPRRAVFLCTPVRKPLRHNDWHVQRLETVKPRMVPKLFWCVWEIRPSMMHTWEC